MCSCMHMCVCVSVCVMAIKYLRQDISEEVYVVMILMDEPFINHGSRILTFKHCSLLNVKSLS